MFELPPLSLYVHIPWCVQKCPYCDFNSHAIKHGGVPEAQYVQAVLADLRQELPQVQGREVQSIFIGGGTPSVFSAEAMGDLITGIADQLVLSADCEITMEANPGTFEMHRFAAYRQLGINRLSVGVQSFDEAHLKALGRIHSGNEAHAALSALPQAGFEHFNVDLMFGLPGQSQAQALADLRQAMAYEPPHLSWYQLTIEPNTAFAARPPVTPEGDALAEMQNAGIAYLAECGLARYEVSAFARPSRASLHNLNYWQFGDYLGIGAGAHGKWTCAQSGRTWRSSKKRHPRAYLAALQSGAFVSQSSCIESVDMPIEFMMNALRLCQGVPVEYYAERTGQSLAQIDSAWQRAKRLGLMQQSETQLQATLEGQNFLNELLMLFMPDATD